MNKHLPVFLILLFGLLALAACGGAAGTETAAVTTGGSTTSTGETTAMATPDPAAAATDAAGAAAEIQAAIAGAKPVEALTADYGGALSVRSQLALGTVQLESTDRAVTAEQATSLLTLWRTLQTLENSGTAAEVEINAVMNQIQSTMTPEQLGAIAALKLTEDDASDLTAFGQGSDGGTGFSGFFPGGTFDGAPPDAIAIPRDGGGPGPGGGGPPGGGPGGGGIVVEGDFGGVNPSAIATAQAEITADPAAMAERMSIGMVIRVLQMKTGEFTGFGSGGGAYGALLAVLADATGLDETAVRDELAAGATPAEFLSNHDTDADAARAALVESLGALQFNADTDIEALADQLLAGTTGGRP